MPNVYEYKDDGKLHTRYSELMNCTEAGIERVLEERFGQRKKLELEAFDFGRARHETLEEEGRVENKVPEYFGVGEVPISHAEESFAIEAFPGVVIHFTPDLVSQTEFLIGDYKMVREPKDGWSGVYPSLWSLYKDSIQLDFYAWLLTFKKIPIREKLYMGEYWNRDRTEILHHDSVRRPITVIDKGKARAWAIPRIERLMAGIKVYEEAGYSPIREG